ncbi:MAG: type I-C CRISPR-associated protein Cas5c [Bacteroidetes bacterium]|nr:type I-C CRISPR-associated protein Cas5c [Bacteroidota bacterium]MCL5025640.1 type I-C CRISPR-associated protein Cas5c [Chloroflexota bacterium]
MSAFYPPVDLRVWGDLACFTRPEMKVERVTYPVMTPSAARGVMEAIFWKPQFSWRIEEIWVLKPIRYFWILRNEVKSRISERAAAGWEKSGGGYDAADDHTPRNTLALREVSYLIRAQVEVKPGVLQNPARFRDQFRRRARNGRCFATPYLGCREFSAAFAEPDGTERPIDLTEDLGPMLLDLEYSPDEPGRGRPRFFNARLEHGVLRVSHLVHAL